MYIVNYLARFYLLTSINVKPEVTFCYYVKVPISFVFLLSRLNLHVTQRSHEEKEIVI